MDDFEHSFEHSFEHTLDNDSDGFSPEKPKKAPKKTAKPPKTTTKKADKTDKPKAPPKPRAKKQKIAEPLQDEPSMDIDRSISILDTPQSNSEIPSPARAPILQEQNEGQKKNASETYKKVLSSQSHLT
jgi:hypothetical protein